MFQVTPAAAATLADIRQQNGIPDGAGLRASSTNEPDGGMAVSLVFTETPAEDDLVIEQEGTSVFVAADLVQPLEDSALDVADTTEGPKFLLRHAGSSNSS